MGLQLAGEYRFPAVLIYRKAAFNLDWATGGNHR